MIMERQTSYGLGPTKTPYPLKVFLLTMLGTSLVTAFFPVIQGLLALTLPGIQHLFLWQFFTYSFVTINPLGISFPFFVQLAFNLYLLWVFGAMLMERSQRLFFPLYFGAGLVAGLCTWGAAWLLGHPLLLSGATTPLYAVMIAWVMLYSETNLVLFMTLPLRALWLILGLIGINLFIDLANADWLGFTSSFSSCLFGYLFSLMAWKRKSAFVFLHPFETWLLRCIDRRPPVAKEPKVYDIHSGKPRLSDEQFMDAMLEKISKSGEESLTPQERERMQQISKKRG